VRQLHQREQVASRRTVDYVDLPHLHPYHRYHHLPHQLHCHRSQQQQLVLRLVSVRKCRMIFNENVKKYHVNLDIFRILPLYNFKHWRRQLWGTGARAPYTSNISGHFRAAHVVAYQVHTYSFVTVYCMNFITFLCVTLKLFFLSFVPLLAPNTGDATNFKCSFNHVTSLFSTY